MGIKLVVAPGKTASLFLCFLGNDKLGPMMTVQEAYELCQSGKAVLVDVREEAELKETGMAAGALWMPLSSMEGDTDEWRAFRSSLARDKKVFLYCKMGGRAGRMAAYLSDDGIEAFCIGGFADWKSAGLPLQGFSR